MADAVVPAESLLQGQANVTDMLDVGGRVHGRQTQQEAPGWQAEAGGPSWQAKAAAKLPAALL